MSEPSCPCGRKSCDDPTPTCVLCPVLTNRKPRHVDTPPACGNCRLQLAALPGDIADAYTWLDQLLEPRRGGQAGTSTKRDEAPIPLAVDPYDLRAGHTIPQGPIRRARLAENVTDQIGHLPVALALYGWVRDWCDRRGLGEHGPIRFDWGVTAEPRVAVPAFTSWLAERTDWAVDHHPAVDEYATELAELRGVLQELVGRTEPNDRPKPITGVPCIRCHHVTLARRHDDTVECQHEDCQSVWRADEYERWSRAAASAARRSVAKIKEAV